MATLKDMDEKLVTVGKPVEGGCVYVNFSENPVFPTDATSKLDAGWESLGDLSDNGYTETKSTSTTPHKDWAGSVVHTSADSEEYGFKFELIEPNRPTAAKLYYGPDNVEVGEDGQVSHIKGASGKTRSCAVLFEELESAGHKRRTVYKRATPTDFDDVTHQSGALLFYGVTFSAESVDGSVLDVYRAKPAKA